MPDVTSLLQDFLLNPAPYMQGALFYAFAAVLLFAATMVVTVRNAVYAVLFLILAFFNAAGLFLLAGAEFLAMTLVIVYVGAVAVLFLFVVMMLDVDFRKLRQGMKLYLPVGGAIGAIFAAELALLGLGWQISPDAFMARAAPIPTTVSNTAALGNVLYTDYLLPFQMAGLVLLVAMVGAIVLTHRGPNGSRRQKIGEQVTRRPDDVVSLKKVTPGEGVDV